MIADTHREVVSFILLHVPAVRGVKALSRSALPHAGAA